jgi:isocitrate/isopropylmalate dehydrogenase
MNNEIKAETRDTDLVKIRENSEDDYWSVKYGVSSEELKKTSHNLGIKEKILNALSKKKVFEF